jgi:hypothetical protein
VVTITDPAAHYGVHIEGLTPNIKTIQVYAPPAKNFIAVEHQFNFADPFGKEWGNMDTDMVTLALRARAPSGMSGSRSSSRKTAFHQSARLRGLRC